MSDYSQNNTGQNIPQDSPALITDFSQPISADYHPKISKSRIIATFLGLMFLAGGLGVGVVLVGQPQLLEQKAEGPVYNYVGLSMCPVDLKNCVDSSSYLKGGYNCNTGTPTFLNKKCCIGNDTNINGECIPDCGVGLNCTQSSLVSGTKCRHRDNGLVGYCCSANNSIMSGVCIPKVPNCGGGYLSCNPVVGLDGKLTIKPENTSMCTYDIGGIKKDFFCCPQNYNIVGTSCKRNTIITACTSDANCGDISIYKCNISTHTCESRYGVGNCTKNTGDCYVKSAIGATLDNTSVCDWGGHWMNCPVGYRCQNYHCWKN